VVSWLSEGRQGQRYKGWSGHANKSELVGRSPAGEGRVMTAWSKSKREGGKWRTASLNHGKTAFSSLDVGGCNVGDPRVFGCEVKSIAQ